MPNLRATMMRTHICLSFMIALALVGCGTTSRAPTTAARPSSDATRPSTATTRCIEVGDLEVHSAVFGSGLKTIDVTDRVVALLKEDNAGFAARNDVLNADPLPYAGKCLVIDYSYKARRCLFFVTNQQFVSYDLLLKNAKG